MESRNKYKITYLLNRFTDLENELMVTSGEGINWYRGAIDWELEIDIYTLLYIKVPFHEKRMVFFILPGNPVLNLSDKNEFFALAHHSCNLLLPAVAHIYYRNNVSVLFILLPLTTISHHLVGNNLTISLACCGSCVLFNF